MNAAPPVTLDRALADLEARVRNLGELLVAFTGSIRAMGGEPRA